MHISVHPGRVRSLIGLDSSHQGKRGSVAVRDAELKVLVRGTGVANVGADICIWEERAEVPWPLNLGRRIGGRLMPWTCRHWDSNIKGQQDVAECP